MIIKIDNHLRIFTSNEKIITRIKKDLTKRNPKYKALVRMNKPTENEPKFIDMWVEYKDHISIPRGMIRYIENLSNKLKVKIEEIIDNRRTHETIDVEIKFNNEFKDFYSYQKRLINLLTFKPFGVGVAGCGAGKTVSAMGIIAKVKQRTLIIVHTKELYNQWLDEIKDKLGGHYTLGQIGAGKRELGDITISLIQTLRNANKEDWEKLNDYFGMIIVDECHRIPSNSYVQVMKQVECKYLYGLSATPNRKDELHFLLYNYIGPIRIEITDEELEQSKKLVPCKIKVIDTNFNVDFSKIGHDWIVYNRMLIKNMYRNRVIIDQVEEDLHNGLYPMILINRVNHGIILSEMLRHKGYKVGLLMGSVEKEERKKILKDARECNIDILISNEKIAGEGLDIKPLDCIHLVYPINNKGNLKQYTGRIRRTYKGKKFGYVRDYRDNITEDRDGIKIRSNLAIRMHKSRDNIYSDFGFTLEK